MQASSKGDRGKTKKKNGKKTNGRKKWELYIYAGSENLAKVIYSTVLSKEMKKKKRKIKPTKMAHTISILSNMQRRRQCTQNDKFKIGCAQYIKQKAKVNRESKNFKIKTKLMTNIAGEISF